jgi:hypothetical protein
MGVSHKFRACSFSLIMLCPPQFLFVVVALPILQNTGYGVGSS